MVARLILVFLISATAILCEGRATRSEVNAYFKRNGLNAVLNMPRVVKKEQLKQEHQTQESLLLSALSATEKSEEAESESESESESEDAYEIPFADACGFSLWKQCNSSYGSEPLGFSAVNTICSAGCAMSSVTEMLHHWGANFNPGTMNSWLKANNGYADADLIIWASVDKFGCTYVGQQKPTSAELQSGIAACHGLIANVRSGTHWVLITGYAGNDNFYVNDPGFNQATYPFSQMGVISVYH